MLSLGRVVGQPSTNRKDGLQDKGRHRLPVGVPLVVEQRLANDWDVGVHMTEKQIEVVHGSVVVWHQFGRNADLETRSSRDGRERVFVLVSVLHGGLLLVAE